MRWRFGLIVVFLARIASADPGPIELHSTDSAVTMRVGAVDALTYVFRDPAVSRPYFAPVRTLSGLQISRNHPPQADQDKTDHLGLHTGIWLSFGDINQNDYWRLKARTEHVKFISPPEIEAGVGRWTVLNRYLSADGKSTVCFETAGYCVELVPQGYLLRMTSEFRADKDEVVFGDQEEMGLGIRVNSKIAVEKKLGGRLLDSEGRRNGGEVWGKTSDWCDYSGPLDGRWVGITLFSSPDNFRPSWNHARDYGFLAVNPFGRAAFTKGEPSRVVIPPGETLTLHFGVYVHESADESGCSLKDLYRQYIQPAPTRPGSTPR